MKISKHQQQLHQQISATTQENIDRVYHIVMHDRRLTVNQIADAVAFSRERIEVILHQELGILKVSAW